MPTPLRPLFNQQLESRRFVRFQRRTDSGFVEFSFGIGSTDLMVELIMPSAAYEEFCAVNNVVRLTDDEAAAVDSEQQKWCYGQPANPNYV
jgi:phenol hydroxylase P0 protein